MHYLFASFGPTGTAALWGMNLFDFTSLIQVVSVTGVWGLSFLVGWFASTVNAIWENGCGFSKKAAAAFAVAMSLVLLFGGFRLGVLKSTVDTVKVGSVVVP